MEIRAVQLILLMVLGACKSDPKPAPAPIPSCDAEVVTDRGSFRATAKAEPKESRENVRKRALEQACERSCRDAEGKVDACRARCLVDIDATKVGARVKCHAFPKGDKGATSG